MPKVRLGSKPTDPLVGLIYKNIVFSGMSVPELAKKVGMTRGTLYMRLREPETFRRDELRSVYKVLHFTAEDKAGVPW